MNLFRLEIDVQFYKDINMGVYKQSAYQIKDVEVLNDYYSLGNLCDGTVFYGNQEYYAKKHPTPWNDEALIDIWEELDGRTEDYIFAFKSLDDLKKWFSNLHDPRLDEFMPHLRIAEYVTSESKVYHSLTQCLVEMDALTLVQIHNPRGI